MTTITWYAIQRKNDGMFRNKHFGWKTLDKARLFSKKHHIKSHLDYNNNRLTHFELDKNGIRILHHTYPDEFEIVEIELKVKQNDNSINRRE